MEKTGRTLKSRNRRWQMVAGAYCAAGLIPHLDDACLTSGYAYDKGEAALGVDPLGDYGVGLHDLAHFLVAPKYRRHRPNFGLGKHPSASETRSARVLVGKDRLWLEEFAATIVNVLLADELFGRRHARHVARTLKLRGLWARSRSRLQAAPYMRLLWARGLLVPDTLTLSLPARLAVFIRGARGEVTHGPRHLPGTCHG